MGRLVVLRGRAVRVTQVIRDDAPASEYAHKAFISYGRADARLAQALQRGLEQLAKPRRTPKIFDVFLDTSDLSLVVARFPIV